MLIVRLGAMGDVIHGLPVAAALRRSFPAVEIGWIIERRWKDLLGQPLVDRVHLADTFAWRKQPFANETRRQLFGLIWELRQARYDVAIDIQGAWKSALLTGLSGARLRLGFREPREAGAGIFSNRTVQAVGAHVIEQNLSLLAGLDQAESKLTPPQPVLPVRNEDEVWLDEELSRRGLAGRPFAVINPGAGWGAKCWPAERYGAVAQALAQLGLVSLINYGPAEEQLAREVEVAAAGSAVALSCTISQLIAVIRRARLFVGGDTGPMHLAAALDVPVVALFGPTDPARNGPYSARAVVLRHASSATDHTRRREPEAGLLAIETGEAIAAARQLLTGSAGTCKEETVV